MALDELHARRLSTVVTVTEDALARIEIAIEQAGKSKHPTRHLAPARIQALRQKIASMRRALEKAVERFDLRLSKPEPQQVLAAELSALWVVLENARPKRLKGYGREWDPHEKADWEKTVENLLHAVEELRAMALNPPSDGH
jgi:hypothetical protein